jgi:hypothetical protein
MLINISHSKISSNISIYWALNKQPYVHHDQKRELNYAALNKKPGVKLSITVH